MVAASAAAATVLVSDSSRCLFFWRTCSFLPRLSAVPSRLCHSGVLAPGVQVARVPMLLLSAQADSVHISWAAGQHDEHAECRASGQADAEALRAAILLDELDFPG